MSVPQYTREPGHDAQCDGLEEALRANPLSFTVKSITWLYEREAVRHRLRSTGRLMAFSTAMVTIRYLLPCTAQTALALGCDPHDVEQCMPCPLEPSFSRVKCCVLSDRESNTMDGEFFRLPAGSHPDPVLEGGHAMGLVGYSDVYRTQRGYVGGWILKNSWWDGLPPSYIWTHARGSHSIAYWMSEISSLDEAQTCPNAHSPKMWYVERASPPIVLSPRVSLCRMRPEAALA